MISVVIPTYNRRALLARALDSVFAQTHAAHEVIVVDDGSIDGTGEFIQQAYPAVRYFYQENRGVSAARNAGIRAAIGDWVALLDSDDAWTSDKLEKQVQAVMHQPDTKVCHTNEIWIRNGVRVNAMKKHAKKGGWIFNECLPLCLISPSSVMLHRSLFDSVGFFDETLPACEDYDLWLRITSLYPVLYIDEALTIKYGGHEDQLSRRYWGMDRFRLQALKKILDSDVLSALDRAAAVDMMQQKLAVYLQGAKKRHKMEEVAYYEQWAKRYVS